MIITGYFGSGVPPSNDGLEILMKSHENFVQICSDFGSRFTSVQEPIQIGKASIRVRSVGWAGPWGGQLVLKG